MEAKQVAVDIKTYGMELRLVSAHLPTGEATVGSYARELQKLKKVLRTQSSKTIICGVDTNAQLGKASTEAETQVLGQHASGTRNSRGRQPMSTMLETGAFAVDTFSSQEGREWTHTQVRDGTVAITWIDHVLMIHLPKTSLTQIQDVPLGVNSTDHRPLITQFPTGGQKRNPKYPQQAKWFTARSFQFINTVTEALK